MAKFRHLKNAPITEAIVDIRVKLPPDVDVARLRTARNMILNEYPMEQEHRLWEGSIELKQSGGVKQTSEDKGILGYVYRSADNKQVVQFRLNGFTFSRLEPYETWDRLRDEAKRLWEMFVKTVSPEVITRVAVRYINRLVIPSPILDFDDCLTAGPVIPENLLQGLSSFLTRVVIPDQSSGATVIITQLYEGMTDPQVVPIILDIDVFKENQFSTDGKDAWEMIEKLRQFKNEVFFGSVTEKTLELYS